MESPEPPKPFCVIFILAIISFFLILVNSVFVLVFIGLIFAGFVYMFSMVCKHRGDTYSASWRDDERETLLFEKVEGLHVDFPDICPECNSIIDLSQVHMVDKITIMCPKCLTVIKGSLNE